jgi:hypothetical protein
MSQETASSYLHFGSTHPSRKLAVVRLAEVMTRPAAVQGY